MRIEFTRDEKTFALQKLGYTVALYEGERDRGLYSNDVEKMKVKTTIAFIGEEPNNLDDMDWYHLISDYGLDSVFETVMKQKFKDFILNYLT